MKYLEIGNTSSGQSFLFVKRISPNKGTFPTHHEVFPERFKRRIGSTPTTTLHEASVVAVKRSTDIEHLQVVSVRDKAGRTNTTKDLVAAAKTWLWFNEIEDLPGIRAESLRRTKEGEAAANTPASLIEELMGWSSQSMMRHYGVNAVTGKKRQAIPLAALTPDGYKIQQEKGQYQLPVKCRPLSIDTKYVIPVYGDPTENNIVEAMEGWLLREAIRSLPEGAPVLTCHDEISTDKAYMSNVQHCWEAALSQLALSTRT